MAKATKAKTSTRSKSSTASSKSKSPARKAPVASKSKPVKKAVKIDKKKAVAAKKPVPMAKKIDAKAAKASKGKKGQLLELGLLCDCTSSMCSWIDRAKRTLQEIIANTVASCEGLQVRVTFVGYRDHCDSQRFSILPFTDDIAKARSYIAGVQATGGGDLPEDVVGGLRKCLDQAWTPGSKRQVFLICDAPEHGTEYYTGWDHHPNGSPEGLKLPELMREFNK